MGKGGKRLQTTNHQIGMLQQDLDDALKEIDRLNKQNNLIIANVENLEHEIMKFIMNLLIFLYDE